MKLMFASGLESLFTLLVFVIIAGLSSWLKRRQQAEEDPDSWTAPPPATPPRAAPTKLPRQGTESPPARAPAPRARGWEEELRRLLEGESSTPKVPPVILQPAPSPVRPAKAAVRRSTGMPARARPQETAPAPAPAPRARKTPDAPVDVHWLDQPREPLGLAEEQMRRDAEATKASPAGVDRLRVRAMLHDRQSVRSAIVLSAILGPPKALDD